jgi:hypothetical protein
MAGGDDNRPGPERLRPPLHRVGAWVVRAGWGMSMGWVCVCTASAGATDLPSSAANSNLASHPARPGPARPDRVEIWLDLSEPELASLRQADPAARTAQRQRIVAEQDRVAAALQALGGVERGRVQLLRNSIAAELPREQVDAARRIPGVRAVRLVRHVDRQPPKPTD